MEFEFDPGKSAANLAKHGIDFLDAQMLWDDPWSIEVPARVSEEERFVVIGQVHGKIWAAVITYRQNAVRIISVRRARETERQAYENQ